MACLYCSEDGARITDNMVPYEGELTVVTHGPLNRGDCRCDSCNRPLERGEKAYLAEFTHRAELHSQASDLFDRGKARVRLVMVEGEEPTVVMKGLDGRFVNYQDWAAPSPSLVDRLRAAIRPEREVGVTDLEIDRDR
jgi:hypothetical protein